MTPVPDVTRVLVAGGGVAGLETVLALQALAGDLVSVELLAPDRHFTYRPLAVAEPFGGARVLRFPLAAIAADRGVRLHRDALARVLAGEREVETQGGERLGYDVLVLALGARCAEAVPGALTFRGPQDADRVRALVAGLADGTLRRVAFVIPGGTTWALPIYELALQTAAAVRGRAPAAELTLVTPERAPLESFGAEVSAAVGDLLAGHGIAVLTGADAQEVAGGRLWLGRDAAPAIDRAVALPRLVGPQPRGVPCDAMGFVPVDEYTRVLGCEAIHAVGDVAAHGIKQGGLSAQQARVAAAVVAAGAGADVTAEPYRPVLRGLLLTGGQPRHLRREPQGPSEASSEPLWWPPAKIAGKYLAPYLATHLDLELTPAPAAVGGAM